MQTAHTHHASSAWRDSLFKAFLSMYLVIVLVHTASTHFTWQVVGALFAGGAVAAIAHRGHGIVPSVLLLTHVVIEWAVHARHGSHYSGITLTFHGMHTLFDASFLYIEAKHHWGRQWKWRLGVAAACISFIFWYLYIPEMKSFAPYVAQQIMHTHTAHWVQQLLVGGILGCVLSHLLARKVHNH